MKQFLFEYSDKESLDRQLLKIKQWCRSFMVSNILFTVYSSKLDKEKLGSICANIKKIVPESSYVGATTNGNIINGDVSKSDTIIACTIFDKRGIMGQGCHDTDHDARHVNERIFQRFIKSA